MRIREKLAKNWGSALIFLFAWPLVISHQPYQSSCCSLATGTVTLYPAELRLKPSATSNSLVETVETVGSCNPVSGAADASVQWNSPRAPLRLRGGAEEEDSQGYRSAYRFFCKVDKIGTKTFGSGFWAFLKSLAGLDEKSLRKKRTVAEELAAIHSELDALRNCSEELVDRKVWYFITQGPSYFLDPSMHFMRYIRGDEKKVRAAMVYLQKPPANALNLTLAKRIALLAAPPPGGFGLTPARINEALYRSKMRDPTAKRSEEYDPDRPTDGDFVEEVHNLTAGAA